MSDGTKIEDLTELELAYIAGLIDGEGSIYVMRHNGRSGVTFYPAVSICMTHAGVLEWLASKLGLTTSNVERTEPGWRNQKMVRIHGKRAVALCRRLFPYLKVKPHQAALILDFPFEDRRGRSPKGRRLALTIVTRRSQLRERVNALNARGRKAG